MKKMDRDFKVRQAEVARMYADLIDAHCDDTATDYPHWATLNALIISTWSISGLLRVKTMAWKIVKVRNQKWMRESPSRPQAGKENVK